MTIYGYLSVSIMSNMCNLVYLLYGIVLCWVRTIVTTAFAMLYCFVPLTLLLFPSKAENYCKIFVARYT